jgi:hypothetical protein
MEFCSRNGSTISLSAPEKKRRRKQEEQDMWILPGAGGSVNLTREIRGLIVKNLRLFSNALAVQQHNARAASVCELCKVCYFSSSWNTLEDNALVGAVMRNLCVLVLRSLNAKRASMQERQTRLEREGEISTLVCMALSIQSIVLIPVQGFGMLGEEDLSHILSANV